MTDSDCIGAHYVHYPTLSALQHAALFYIALMSANAPIRLGASVHSIPE